MPYGEAALAGGLAHDLDGDAQQAVRPVHQLAGEAAVGAQGSGAAGLADVVEVPAEQGAPPTLAVVDAGGADQDRQQQAERVSDNEPLPTAGLLAGVVACAVSPDRVGAVPALGLDRPGGRVGVASLRGAEPTTQPVMPPCGHPGRLPPGNGAIYRLPRREAHR